MAPLQGLRIPRSPLTQGVALGYRIDARWASGECDSPVLVHPMMAGTSYLDRYGAPQPFAPAIRLRNPAGITQPHLAAVLRSGQRQNTPSISRGTRGKCLTHQ